MAGIPQVIRPQMGGKTKAQQDQSTIFSLGGAVIGGVFGGAGGAIAGAGAGQAASNLLDAKSSGEALGAGLGVAQGAQGVADRTVQAQPGASPAMQRRLDALGTDELQALQQAESAAAVLPEDQRQRILPTLTQARLLEQRKRGGLA